MTVSNERNARNSAVAQSSTTGNHRNKSRVFEASAQPRPRPRKAEMRTMFEKYAIERTFAGSHRISANSKKSARKLISTNETALSRCDCIEHYIDVCF